MQQSMLSKTFYFGCGLVSIFDGDQKLDRAGYWVLAVIGKLPQNQTVEMVMGRRLRPATHKETQREMRQALGSIPRHLQIANAFPDYP